MKRLAAVFAVLALAMFVVPARSASRFGAGPGVLGWTNNPASRFDRPPHPQRFIAFSESLATMLFSVGRSFPLGYAARGCNVSRSCVSIDGTGWERAMTVSIVVPIGPSTLNTDPHGLLPLLEAAIAGNRSAMDELLRKLRPYLHALVRSQVPPRRVVPLDDSALVQEGLIRVSQNLTRLRQRTVPHFLGWVGRIVHHLVVDALIDQGNEPVTSVEARVVDGLIRALSRDGQDMQERRLLRVAQALDQLADRRRRVIELTFLDELSDAEICERLGGSVGAVRVLRFRALEDVRRILESCPDSDCRPKRNSAACEKGHA